MAFASAVVSGLASVSGSGLADTDSLMEVRASSTALRKACLSAAPLAIDPKTVSISVAIGNIVSTLCACLLVEVVRIASVAVAAGWRRAAAHEDFAPAGCADAAVLADDDACA